MESSTQMGMNRTGAQTSPIDSKAMNQISSDIPPDIAGSEECLADARNNFITEAESIGSVPLPASIKGAAKTAMKKIMGHGIEVFIDKLGERVAFEQTGARLYDALLAKAKSFENTQVDLLEKLQHFRDEEVEHLSMLIETFNELGADPTAQTPCADLAGVESSGVLKVMTDPRTTLAQSFNALLTAEMTDQAGWELLIKLAKQVGHEELQERFEKALAEENTHAQTIRNYLEHEVLTEAGA